MSYVDHAIYALLWLSYGWGHSVLAGERVKRQLHSVFGAAYRIAYNLFAVVHIGAILVGGRYLLADASRFALPPAAEHTLTALQWAGVAVIVVALLQYDLGRFSGLTQLRSRPGTGMVVEDEPLHVTGLHRLVRHPLYTGAFLFLWGNVRTEFDLATALWGCLYLVIGTYFEERKLLTRYREDYARYKKRVPAYVPWKGRAP